MIDGKKFEVDDLFENEISKTDHALDGNKRVSVWKKKIRTFIIYQVKWKHEIKIGIKRIYKSQ